MAVLHLLLSRCAGSRFNPTTPTPIVMLPGILCSQLQAKLTNSTICKRNSDWFTTWITPENLLRATCFAAHMNLTTNSSNPCSTNTPGVQIRVPHFGNTTGFDTLNPAAPLGPAIELFLGLTNRLKASFGGGFYQEGTTLRGAGYDWRKFSDPCYTSAFATTLQHLIEETVALAHGRPVTLLCHSMGCNVAHLFLATTVSSAWKKQHVHQFIALAPSFAGAPIALKQYLFGTAYDSVPGFAQVFRYWPGLAALLPCELSSRPEFQLWTNTTFVASPSHNYTGTAPNVVGAVLSRAAHADLRKRPGLNAVVDVFWPRQRSTIRDQLVDVGPGVVSHVLYLDTVPTIGGVVVDDDGMAVLNRVVEVEGTCGATQLVLGHCMGRVLVVPPCL